MKTTADHEGGKCPCKSLPLALSRYTAAEHGDVASLLRHADKDVNKVSQSGGYNLLHFAAQHGHAALTATLLHRGALVDGTPKSLGGCGATPLHRASYSGAVSAMRVLLNWTGGSSGRDVDSCNLLAQDESFGDKMTPLHKATAGGRYLAVQLLIEALTERSAATQGKSNLVVKAIQAVDAMGRTPLDVATEKIRHEEEEMKSVARWDGVAGGRGDFKKCQSLLLSAESKLGLGDINKAKPLMEVPSSTSHLPKLPPHLLAANDDSCLDCGGVEQCRTAKWEKSFWASLSISVDQQLAMQESKKGRPALPNNSDKSNLHPADTPHERNSNKDKNKVDSKQNESPPGSSSNCEMGHPCGICRTNTLTLFRGRAGLLVCRGCIRKKPKPPPHS